MPHDYDLTNRVYRVNGKYIERREIRQAVDRLSEFVKKEAARTARKFDEGEITAAEFNLAMRELLKSGHIVAAVTGRGGREMMTPSDWGKVGSKIKWQYQYLDKFTQKLELGTLKIANTANRAKQYVNAIYISYADTTQKAMTEFVEGGGNANPKGEMLVRLITNSVEGCSECAADEDDGWVPVSEMKELGDRICGDFCRCVLEFENEI